MAGNHGVDSNLEKKFEALKQQLSEALKQQLSEALKQQLSEFFEEMKKSKIYAGGDNRQVTPPEKISVAAPTKKWLIDDHFSYHGLITHEEAESRLKEHGGNCYLTRYSTGRKTHVISVMKSNGSIRHFNINITNDVYEIDGTDLPFSSIFHLLAHYSIRVIDDETGSIGEACSQAKVPAKDDSVPSLKNLTLLKWEDGHGTTQRLRLIQELSHKWETIGTLLQISKLKNLTKGPEHNCKDVFEAWITSQGCKGYPLSWDGIFELLSDIEDEATAKRLKEALKQIKENVPV